MKSVKVLTILLILAAAASLVFSQGQAINPADFPKAAKVFDKPAPRDTQVEKLKSQVTALQAQLQDIQNTKHECTMACCREVKGEPKPSESR